MRTTFNVLALSILGVALAGCLDATDDLGSAAQEGRCDRGPGGHRGYGGDGHYGDDEYGDRCGHDGHGPGKVTVCHVPPGNPGNAHTIRVSRSAVRAHLAHGDYLGECASTCAPEGGACADTDDCCLGECRSGACMTVCAPGALLACYDGPAGTAGVGACVAGARKCEPDGGGYGNCIGQVTPTDEVCGDGLDNDCDGDADESCVCVPGSIATCYDGPAGTAGVGVCVAGARKCAPDGGGYGNCVGSVGPSAEVCGDGLDNDCDGVADDGCSCAPGSTLSCYDLPTGTAGVGVCAAGTQACNADGTGYGACLGAIGPSAEVCGDGLDNDCDGASDEGCVCAPGSGQSCYSGAPGTEGVGACVAGTQTCAADGTAWGACAGEVTPTAEVCGNGLDDDCDGVADDGCVCAPGSTATCDTGSAGVCAAGIMTCNVDGTGYGVCVAVTAPVAEACGNGLDDDCDGVVDDGCVCAPGTTVTCSTGSAGVCAAGAQTCNADGTGYGECVAVTAPVAEVCGNGLDDDCDGRIDEGCIGDRAWNDRDRDGLQDPGEAGIPGVTFLLRSASTGALIAVVVSSTTGAYSFSGVPAGSYYIEAIRPVGLTFTIPDAGNDALDNDFDGEFSATEPFTFSGDTLTTIDCGMYSVVGT
ncbi:MAG: hypothetical protein KBG48_15835 [Kofleriaceae bacterium]|jgi:hypothetical protein|nr:hypothetical protein [Kofleriaceae bacterium]MBP9168869.1 hypothetical protein [Kofleriaceae bacterium]MBP9862754.1 hypothetical protein [Kofleriaceae bacterium]